MRQCIQNCLECHSICVETAQHCLMLGGEHAGAKHVRLLLDCAQICQTCADFMLRTSHYHIKTCGVCAEICRDCAKSCEQMAGEDETMKKCAEACGAARNPASRCRKPPCSSGVANGSGEWSRSRSLLITRREESKPRRPVWRGRLRALYESAYRDPLAHRSYRSLRGRRILRCTGTGAPHLPLSYCEGATD